MTRKLTLEPESLSVESFESGKAADLQGDGGGVRSREGALRDLGEHPLLVPALMGLLRGGAPAGPDLSGLGAPGAAPARSGRGDAPGAASPAFLSA